MFYLKKKVTNKAKVEGFICEAYLIDEITNFASHYFGEITFGLYPDQMKKMGSLIMDLLRMILI